MHNRYSDFRKLRLTGQVYYIPDKQLNKGCEADPEQQPRYREREATPRNRQTPAESAALVARRYWLARRNVDSVSLSTSVTNPSIRMARQT